MKLEAIPKILVLGGGKQGLIVAEDLNYNYNVTVVDQYSYSSCILSQNIKYIQADLSKQKELLRLAKGYDLVIGALPSKLGLQTLQTLLKIKGLVYVDMSFMLENARYLQQLAIDNGVVALLQCGIAPGISNLLVGRAVRLGYKNIHVFVGGVSAKRKNRYLNTWSLEDLYEEYTRPTRIIRDGKVIQVETLYEYNPIYIDGVGYLRPYTTDGLGSLLTLPVENLAEFTLRWPGHIDEMRPHLGSYPAFSRYVLSRKRTSKKCKDVLAMKVAVKNKSISLLVKSDGISAMSRATAFSCCAFARAILERNMLPGLYYPEDFRYNSSICFSILNHLASHGIRFTEEHPFL